MAGSRRQQITEETEERTVEVVPVADITREELHDVTTWDQALALAEKAHGSVLSIADTDLADGFRKASEEDKLRLCGVPILIITWSFAEGDYDDHFTVLRLIAKEPSGGDSKWVVADGGKGITKDLQDFTRKTGRMGGLLVPKGFRVSHFKINSETKEPVTKSQERAILGAGGKVEPAMTFYLDSSA